MLTQLTAGARPATHAMSFCMASGGASQSRSSGSMDPVDLWPGPTEFTDNDIRSLTIGLRDLRGRVEAPGRARFLVVTVPAAAGFPAIEAAVEDWVGRREGVEWYFGNVYDERDRPLNWWAQGA